MFHSTQPEADLEGRLPYKSQSWYTHAQLFAIFDRLHLSPSENQEVVGVPSRTVADVVFDVLVPASAFAAAVERFLKYNGWPEDHWREQWGHLDELTTCMVSSKELAHARIPAAWD